MQDDGVEDNVGAVSEWGFAGNGHSDDINNNGEGKKRRNKSSSGNRKSKVITIIYALSSLINYIYSLQSGLIRL